jgi:hypothetical protein
MKVHRLQELVAAVPEVAALAEEAAEEGEDTADDLLIAQMLQKQFDSEHDNALTKEERQINGSSKVGVLDVQKQTNKFRSVSATQSTGWSRRR